MSKYVLKSEMKKYHSKFIKLVHTDYGKRRIMEKELIALYKQGTEKNQKLWRKVFSDVDIMTNLFNFQEELKTFNIAGNVNFFDFDKINKIYNRKVKIASEIEKYYEIKNEKLDNILSELSDMSGFKFVLERTQGLSILLDESNSNYKRLDIEKIDDYLRFILIDEARHFDHDFSNMIIMGGYGCGCDVEETLNETDLDDEIIDESEYDDIKSKEDELIDDLKSEGTLYRKILDNISIINEHSKNKRVEFNNLMSQLFKERVKETLKILDINKTYEIEHDSNFGTDFNKNGKKTVYIKKINDDNFRIYIRENDVLNVHPYDYNYNYNYNETDNQTYFTLSGCVSKLMIEEL